MEKSFITTPIYYVNDRPHIGHAYATVAADVFARAQKILQKDTYLLTGTDEHGAKIAKAAGEKGVTPLAWANDISKDFKKSWDDLDINYDQFIRTTDPRHEKVVCDLLSNIYEAGYIYQGVYAGLYCVGCEEYKKPEDLDNGACPVHKKPVEEIKEDVWFFKLSAFGNKVKEAIVSNTIDIYPETRKNEVLAFLDRGLEDIAISRSKVEWGISLPWDKTQTIYVWIDALINYYSATIIADKKELFPADVHFIGKDILRFHAVIWPAILMAADLPTPKKISVHGFFTIDGQKMGKSLGNVIKPEDLIKEFGVDATRYLLLSQFPFGQDGDFSIAKLTDRYNADLANSLGNLVQRNLVVANKLGVHNLEELIGNFANDKGNVDEELKSSFDINLKALNSINSFNLYEAVEEIRNAVSRVNQYIDVHKPWAITPASPEAVKVIGNISTIIHFIAVSLMPIMPTTAQNIINQLQSGVPEPLFPRK